MKNNWEEEFDRLSLVSPMEDPNGFLGVWDGYVLPNIKVFISRIEQEAKEEGRREMLEECVDMACKLRLEEESREITDEDEQWYLDNGPETLCEAMKEGYDNALIDLSSALKSKLTPKE